MKDIVKINANVAKEINESSPNEKDYVWEEALYMWSHDDRPLASSACQWIHLRHGVTSRIPLYHFVHDIIINKLFKLLLINGYNLNPCQHQE